MDKQNYYSSKILNLISENILKYSLNDLKDIYKIFDRGETKSIPASNTKNIYNDFLIKEGVKSKQFDLPYFFDFKKETNIMIIGMDANTNHRDDDVVVLSTPYFLQAKDSRETNKNDYWKIISFLSNHYNIYLTDVYKAYFISTDISNRIPKYKKNNLHAEILKQEIIEINPSAIICWGNHSRNLVSKIAGVKLLDILTKDSNYPYRCNREFNNIKLIATPHPSNRTFKKAWLSFYNANLPHIPYIKNHRPETLAKFILSKLK